jgi:hypothetical protein
VVSGVHECRQEGEEREGGIIHSYRFWNRRTHRVQINPDGVFVSIVGRGYECVHHRGVTVNDAEFMERQKAFCELCEQGLGGAGSPFDPTIGRMYESVTIGTESEVLKRLPLE